jgi:hypothetical protein
MLIKSIRRGGKPGKSTEGDVFVDGVFECYCLEDVIRPDGVKVRGATAIPEGTYRVEIRYSPHFKRLTLHLIDVHGFEYVLVHAGNTDADTHGCILVGDDQGKLNDNWIGRSRIAEDRLFKKVHAAIARGEEVWWTVTSSGLTPR